MGRGIGKSPITVTIGEQEQSSPQQPLLLFLESEQGFLQQSFWHLDLALCLVVSFLHLSFPPHAHTELGVIAVKTNNNITLSNMERINFMDFKRSVTHFVFK